MKHLCTRYFANDTFEPTTTSLKIGQLQIDTTGEMVNQLTLQIKQDLFDIGKSQVSIVQTHYSLAGKLLRLSELVGNEKTDFFKYIKKFFNISER